MILASLRWFCVGLRVRLSFNRCISIFVLVFILKADPLLWLEKSLAAHVGKQSVGLSADAKLDNKPLSHHQPRPSSYYSRPPGFVKVFGADLGAPAVQAPWARWSGGAQRDHPLMECTPILTL